MSDIRGIGLDICEIARMKPLLDNEHFLKRYFSEREAAYVLGRGAAAADTLAGCYAAKEAVCKALGCGIAFSLRDIEIDHTPQGMPIVTLHGDAARFGGRFLLSITHDAGVAAATAIWVKE